MNPAPPPPPQIAAKPFVLELCWGSAEGILHDGKAAARLGEKGEEPEHIYRKTVGK